MEFKVAELDFDKLSRHRHCGGGAAATLPGRRLVVEGVFAFHVATVCSSIQNKIKKVRHGTREREQAMERPGQ